MLQDMRSVDGSTTLMNYIAANLAAREQPPPPLLSELPHVVLLVTTLAVRLRVWGMMNLLSCQKFHVGKVGTVMECGEYSHQHPYPAGTLQEGRSLM